DFVPLNGKLNVHQPDDFEGARQLEGVLAHGVQQVAGNVNGWQHTGGIAGVDAGFFDVLHNAGDDHVLAVGERVDIDLGGFFQKMIDENGALLGVLDGFFHVARNRFIVVGDDHGASAEHVRGADQHGISDTISGLQSLFDASGD